jgi:hypothetical protein
MTFEEWIASEEGQAMSSPATLGDTEERRRRILSARLRVAFGVGSVAGFDSCRTFVQSIGDDEMFVRLEEDAN